jgi:multidrug resistance efflux pump
MKILLSALLLLVALSANAQQTTCQVYGNTVQCNTQPSQQSWTNLLPQYQSPQQQQLQAAQAAQAKAQADLARQQAEQLRQQTEMLRQQQAELQRQRAQQEVETNKAKAEQDTSSTAPVAKPPQPRTYTYGHCLADCSAQIWEACRLQCAKESGK